jgi:hypothetical protein
VYTCLFLEDYYNNAGFTYPKEEHRIGDFSGAGSSYVADELITKDGIFEFEGIPFRLRAGEGYNNIEANLQSLSVEKEYKCTKIHILGASDNGSFKEKIKVVYADEMDEELQFGLTDWISGKPSFENREILRFKGIFSSFSGKVINDFKPTIWYTFNVLSKSSAPVKLIKLPDNPGFHIFSITLELVVGETRAKN